MSKNLPHYLGIFTAVLVVIVVGTRFADYVLWKNTVLSLYTTCDPLQDSCFISDEDNAYFELQLEPYKKIEIIDKDSPTCLQEHNCPTFTCEGIISCTEIYCSEEAIEEGEWCTENHDNYDDTQMSSDNLVPS